MNAGPTETDMANTETPWTLDATCEELIAALESLCDACERCADPTPTMERRVEIARALLSRVRS